VTPTDFEFFEENGYYEDYPGVFIPCEDIENLQPLIYTLYNKGILNSETPFLMKNVPEDMMEILNDPDYFNETELFGITLTRSQLKQLERPTDELL
jgi:hypothetical protein